MRLAWLASMQRLFTHNKAPPQSESFAQLQLISPLVQATQEFAPESSILQRWPFSQFPLPKQGQLALPTQPVQRLLSQARPLLQLLSVLHAQPAVPSGHTRQIPSSQRSPASQSDAPIQRQAALPGLHRSVGPASCSEMPSSVGVSDVFSEEARRQSPS